MHQTHTNKLQIMFVSIDRTVTYTSTHTQIYKKLMHLVGIGHCIFLKCFAYILEPV